MKSNIINVDTLELKTNISDCVNTTCKSAIVDSKCCPHCGESYYMENFCTTTAVYYPPIYKDGININPDRNAITVNCTCLNCGKDFCFVR